jgi:hypothetical protein
VSLGESIPAWTLVHEVVQLADVDVDFLNGADRKHQEVPGRRYPIAYDRVLHRRHSLVAVDYSCTS